MVVVYATLIIKGSKTIGDIPSVIQQQVKRCSYRYGLARISRIDEAYSDEYFFYFR